MDELARRRKQRRAEQAAAKVEEHPLAVIIDDLGVARGFLIEAEAATAELASSAAAQLVSAARTATEAAIALVKEEIG